MEMKIQYMLSSGRWIDVEDGREEEFIGMMLENNGEDETGKIVPSCTAVKTTTREKITAALAAGQMLRNDPEDWYSNCRAKPAPVVLTYSKEQLVKCDCGHTVRKGQVMSASLGTACPECYDRMSE